MYIFLIFRTKSSIDLVNWKEELENTSNDTENGSETYSQIEELLEIECLEEKEICSKQDSLDEEDERPLRKRKRITIKDEPITNEDKDEILSREQNDIKRIKEPQNKENDSITEEFNTNHEEKSSCSNDIFELKKQSFLAEQQQHAVEMFFSSMAKTVMTFPPDLIAETRLKVCQVVSEMEIKAIKAEQNRIAIQQISSKSEVHLKIQRS